jgi:hypothetical protein
VSRRVEQPREVPLGADAAVDLEQREQVAGARLHRLRGRRELGGDDRQRLALACVGLGSNQA